MSNKDSMRVSKLVANYGNYSRRQVDKLILSQDVIINGALAELGQKATIDDDIVIEGKKVQFKTKHVYYALNKPKGFICSREDEKGKEVISLVPEFTKRNLFTIGRLDVNTSGLIVVTTDGNLAQMVSRPEKKVHKEYLVFLSKKMSTKDMIQIKGGIVLDDGYKTKPVERFKVIKNEDDNAVVKITISEGKKNQIRRMFEATENPVVNLKRISIGYLELNNLVQGDYKVYKKEEIYKLLRVEIEKEGK